MKMYAELIGNYKSYRIKSLQGNKLIIDADYYDNPSNEGEIFFQIINISPFDIILKKGDKIGQGIIKMYEVTDEDFLKTNSDYAFRTGGFGSTNDNSCQKDCQVTC